MTKDHATFTITREVLDEFKKKTTVYSKSALVESFIIEFLERVKKT